jgi:hypothetical protein
MADPAPEDFALGMGKLVFDRLMFLCVWLIPTFD